MISNAVLSIKSGLTDFRINILLRLVLILCTMSLLAGVYHAEQVLIFSMIGIAILLSIQIYLLFYYMQSTQREMESFFDAVRYEDGARRINTRFKQSQHLKVLWEELQTQLQQLRQKNEELVRYYSLLLEKVPVALVVVEDEGEGGKIELVNSAAQQLFKRSYLTAMDQLHDYGAQLALDIRQITAGEQRSSHLLSDQVSIAVAVSAAAIQLHSGTKKVISIQPIQRELDRQEILAWQNLVQVFTHEIMNSMTPVASLSKTANELLLTQLDNRGGADESLQDAQQAIHTVARRAEHLMQFVQAYRRIANPPQLKCVDIVVQDLLMDVCRLFQVQAGERGIILRCTTTPEHLRLHADPAHVEQALINLVKNAVDAVAEKTHGHIFLKAYIGHGGNVLIDVIDNGAGIAAEKLEQIFVPFYTSKRDGTGVGLFLVKQIMQAHRGSVCALQGEKGGSILRLMF
jgi:two-component system, NtrC family, nitrogen regulation sensor histidine kinase NtrY